jgi:LPXTG-motif cell wall anchor domain protein
LGIEFTGLSEKDNVAVVSLSFVKFVQNLNELDTEAKNTNKSDLINQSNLVQRESTLVTNSTVNNHQSISDESQNRSKFSKKNLTGEKRARLPRTGQHENTALLFLGIFILLFNYLLIGKKQSKE